MSYWDRFIHTLSFSFQQSYGLTEADCEDFRQDLRLKLFGIAPETRPYRPLVRTILNNAARDSHRKWRRHQANISYSQENHLFDQIPAPEPPPDPDDNKRTVELLLNTLPDLQQQLLKKHFGLEGKAMTNMAMLARSMGMSEPACQAELQNALQYLRAQGIN